MARVSHPNTFRCAVPTFEVCSVRTCPVLCKASRDPGWRPDPGVQLVDFIRYFGGDLDAAAAHTNDSHAFSFEIKICVITCCMANCALERVQAFNVGHFPVTKERVSLRKWYHRSRSSLLENAGIIDEYFGRIDKSHSTLQILHRNFPDTFLVVP